MKHRLYSLLLRGLLLLALCACEQQAEAPVTAPEPEPVAESTAPPINRIPRDHPGEWETLVEAYHTEDRLWSEATPLQPPKPLGSL